ncbi:hypothetical protein D3C78_1029460 [compost metagenome]
MSCRRCSCCPASPSPRWSRPNRPGRPSGYGRRGESAHEKARRVLLRLGRALAAGHPGRRRRQPAVRVLPRGTGPEAGAVATPPQVARPGLRRLSCLPAPPAGTGGGRPPRWLGPAADGSAVPQAGHQPRPARPPGLHRRPCAGRAELRARRRHAAAGSRPAAAGAGAGVAAGARRRGVRRADGAGAHRRIAAGRQTQGTGAV